jgi:phosphopantothenoylcysteine decarboxylase/phosphopantothenate--cysteine ligase
LLTNQEKKAMNILLGISGGIAAYKTPKLVSLFRERGDEVRVIATANALRFVSPLTLAALSGFPVLSDLWADGGDYEMNHIRLPEWADLFLVAPASANFLGKAANGLADDLLSTAFSATGAGKEAACPVILSPAMNTRMWQHPATQRNLQQLIDWGIQIIPPTLGRLACTDQGEGRMPEPIEILEFLSERGRC